MIIRRFVRVGVLAFVPIFANASLIFTALVVFGAACTGCWRIVWACLGVFVRCVSCKDPGRFLIPSCLSFSGSAVLKVNVSPQVDPSSLYRPQVSVMSERESLVDECIFQPACVAGIVENSGWFGSDSVQKAPDILFLIWGLCSTR